MIPGVVGDEVHLYVVPATNLLVLFATFRRAKKPHEHCSSLCRGGSGITPIRKNEEKIAVASYIIVFLAYSKSKQKVRTNGFDGRPSVILTPPPVNSFDPTSLSIPITLLLISQSTVYTSPSLNFVLKSSKLWSSSFCPIFSVYFPPIDSPLALAGVAPFVCKLLCMYSPPRVVHSKRSPLRVYSRQSVSIFSYNPYTCRPLSKYTLFRMHFLSCVMPSVCNLSRVNSSPRVFPFVCFSPASISSAVWRSPFCTWSMYLYALTDERSIFKMLVTCFVGGIFIFACIPFASP